MAELAVFPSAPVPRRRSALVAQILSVRRLASILAVWWSRWAFRWFVSDAFLVSQDNIVCATIRFLVRNRAGEDILGLFFFPAILTLPSESFYLQVINYFLHLGHTR